MKTVVLVGRPFDCLRVHSICNSFHDFKVIGWCNYSEKDAISKKIRAVNSVAATLLKLCGLHKKSISETKSLSASHVIDGVILTTKWKEGKKIYNGIRNEFEQVWYIMSSLKTRGFLKYVKKYYTKLDTTKPLLEYFEYHLTDSCNLNCKGCGHICNNAEEHFPDIAEYERSLKKIKELFCSVLYIKLLGGEPFLNPQLKEFIGITRRYFPEADIQVWTNGLLVPKADEEIFRVGRKAYATFAVTLYPSTAKMKDKIVDRLRREKVSYTIGKPVAQFSKYLHINKSFDLLEAHANCPSTCKTLYDGKLAQCGIVFYAKYLNERYDLNLKIGSGCYVLLDEEIDGWEVENKLGSPIPFCAHCGSPVMFDWKGGVTKNAKLSDYVCDAE